MGFCILLEGTKLYPFVPLKRNFYDEKLHTMVTVGMLNVVKFILKMSNFEDLINEQDNVLHMVRRQSDVVNDVNILVQDGRVDNGHNEVC